MQYEVYDYIIVGAGISGLLSATKIAERYPKARIAVMEAYGTAGGRIQTYKKDGLQWEKGAGRIHSTHKMVNDLVQKYNLTKIKIPDHTDWLSENGQAENNHWPAIATIIIETFSQCSPQELQVHTLEQLLHKVVKDDMVTKMISQFAYTSEISSLRADMALESLRKELGPLNGHFYTIAEGIQSITDNMMKQASKAGVKFFFHHRLASLENGIYASHTKLNFVVDKTKKIQCVALKVILAIHSEALKGLATFKNLPILKKITMNPLLRIYGVFPTPWFEGIPRTVTSSPLRHVIPISTKTNTIMTSYTDGEDTKFWMSILKRYGEKGVSKRIIKESEELFQRKIPEPHVFKMYYWKEGCSYWLPGLYDVHEYSQAIMQPLPLKNPNIFVCGESYAANQAWVESALEHTNEMLNRYIL
jgi:hypothetical protein